LVGLLFNAFVLISYYHWLELVDRIILGLSILDLIAIVALFSEPTSAINKWAPFYAEPEMFPPV